MKKVYKPLTDDQTRRGVIFSSTLSTNRTELMDDLRHEVKDTDDDKHDQIRRLLDDSFFNGSPWKYNIIRR